MPKRWYDTEPTLSLAVSMLKNATPDKQDSVCELVQKKFKEMGIKQQTETFIVFKFFNKRWYDEKENLYGILETLRCCNEEQRRTIALCIIDHLCNLIKA